MNPRDAQMAAGVTAGGTTSADMVNHPPHYTAGRKFEPIDVFEDWFPSDPLLWQVAKYLSRAGRKGSAIEDLRKARFYLDRAIDREGRRV